VSDRGRCVAPHRLWPAVPGGGQVLKHLFVELWRQAVVRIVEMYPTRFCGFQETIPSECWTTVLITLDQANAELLCHISGRIRAAIIIANDLSKGQGLSSCCLDQRWQESFRVKTRDQQSKVCRFYFHLIHALISLLLIWRICRLPHRVEIFQSSPTTAPPLSPGADDYSVSVCPTSRYS
jgi:hypothetical protein